MKKIVVLIMVLTLISCKKETSKNEIQNSIENYSEGEPAQVKTPEILGKEIFEGKGNCISCHQINQKIIGPSIKEIAKIYKDKNKSIVAFLQEKSEPIVDPSQFEVMKANFSLTKAMSNEELKALEAYFYSNLE